MSRLIRDPSIINGGISFGSSVTVAINANTDDLVIPDLENTVEVRIDNTGNNDLTGIVPVDDEVAQWIVVFNVGSGIINLKDNDASSTANARFLIGTNKTVQSNEGITFIYDDVDKRWRSFGINI